MRKSLSLLLFVALVLSNAVLPSFIFAQEKGEKSEKDRYTAKQPKTESQTAEEFGEPEDDDLPASLRGKIDKGEYLQARQSQIDLIRGLPYPQPDVRNKAVFAAMRSENALKLTGKNSLQALGSWRYLGPSPIPTASPTSGRTSAIAVHPTNPDIAYVGTAQGGLYRTLNGGATWTPLMDNELSLAIGAVTISPSDPTTVYVGTGEPALSGDAFFGVGLYRITTADTNPVVSGPIGSAEFNGRAISEILVHPTDANTIFVSTATGTCGTGGCTGNPTPSLGIYRSSNALAATPAFTKLNVTAANGGNRAVMDMVMEPGVPDNIVCWVRGNAGTGDGGIYRSTNATSASPTFTQTYTMVTNGSRGELAIQKTGSVVTVVAATGEVAGGSTQGAVFRSTDGGVTFPTQLTAGNNFCNPQCFYDIAIAFDPTNANNVYLGGAPNTVFKRSTDGGTTFVSSAGGLHVDTHAITVAPSNPQVIYFGSDGGIYRSINGGTSWTSLNNATFAATQFQSIALHPLDRNYLLGGTQDNGTEHFTTLGGWVNSDGGDGGSVVIDQNATTPNDVVAYHTYFNSSGSQIGFIRATTTVTGGPDNGDPNWATTLGCFGGVSNNGIACSDSTLFYAPMVGGPGNPNTLYFGSNKLYRSADRGTTMTAVSQTMATTVSTIGISPQDDNVRIIGLSNGGVFATTTGATTLTQMTGGFPTRYVGRAVIDPNNVNTAYVTFNGYGVAAGQHVWKTTNLNAPTPTWAAAGNGIPDVPVNAFVVDPNNSNNLFAGTDVGVFNSTDGGATWASINNGQLPRVAVFDMAISKPNKVLKIATHGRGIWELNLVGKSKVADFDGDGRTDYSVYRPSNGTWYALRSATNSALILQFGASTDTTVPADYDGDGKTDIAVFRSGTWYILNSRDNSVRILQWGASTDTPVAGDYDGDGKADIGVFRGGTWYILRSTDSGATILNWGAATDTVVPADYDGDGKTDVAVFRAGTWYVLRSGGGVGVTQWGTTGDVPATGDYDGDNKADLTVFRNGTWYALQSTFGVKVLNWGLGTDTVAPGDYDGDGKTDFGVYRNGAWYVQTATSNVNVIGFGTTGDTALPPRQNPYFKAI